MYGIFGDTFDALLTLQKALEGRLASDWLRDATSSRGPFPPINVFQQGDDFASLFGGHVRIGSLQDRGARNRETQQPAEVEHPSSVAKSVSAETPTAGSYCIRSSLR